jgi:hypothetical protein
MKSFIHKHQDKNNIIVQIKVICLIIIQIFHRINLIIIKNIIIPEILVKLIMKEIA